MKVGNLEPSQSGKVQSKKTGKTGSIGKNGSDAVSAKSSSAAAPSSDRVQISDAGKQMRLMKTQYQAIPDQIRTDRIAEVKDQIAAGTYDPAPEKIAEAIINHVINFK